MLRDQSDAIKAEKQKLTVLGRYLEPGKGGFGRYNSTAGYSSPTPVTDGKHVYVIFGNGLAACYDLDGNRQWLKLIDQPAAAYGHGSSPLLAGDKLLVHFSDLVALNTRDGTTREQVGKAIHEREKATLLPLPLEQFNPAAGQITLLQNGCLCVIYSGGFGKWRKNERSLLVGVELRPENLRRSKRQMAWIASTDR